MNNIQKGEHTLRPVPQMSGLPGVGNLISMSADPLDFLVRTARRFPDLVHVRMLGGGYVQVNDPHLIEEVLVARSAAFHKDKGLKVYARAVFGDGLLSSDGDFWLRQRRLAQPAFHRERIAGYADLIRKHTLEAMAAWRVGEVRDVHEDMMRTTLRIVADALFGAQKDESIVEIGECLDVIMARFDVRGVVALLEQALGRVIDRAKQERYEAAVQRLDAIVDGVIERSRRDTQHADHLLAMLIAARDEDGSAMSDAQLRDESRTMFIAGHETTALSLSWTFWLLALNRDAHLRLREELEHVLAGRAPELSDLPKLTYTDQVIRESMRLMPPAWSIQREAMTDVEIGGYRIPKGSDVLLSQYAMHRDSRFFKEPERFLPERWTPEFTRHLPKYAYFPFGGGPRLCIGQQFAQMEAVLMLAMIVQRFDMELAPGQRIVPQPSITMRPKYGLKMRLRAAE
jgi:cytochrome P450